MTISFRWGLALCIPLASAALAQDATPDSDRIAAQLRVGMTAPLGFTPGTSAQMRRMRYEGSGRAHPTPDRRGRFARQIRGGDMGTRKQSSCRETGHACEFRVAHGTTYHSPDGNVFRVRRLVCSQCGKREMVAKKQAGAFAPPAWQEDDNPVEANF